MKYFKKLSEYATCLILSLCFLLMGTFNIKALSTTYNEIEYSSFITTGNNVRYGYDLRPYYILDDYKVFFTRTSNWSNQNTLRFTSYKSGNYIYFVGVGTSTIYQSGISYTAGNTSGSLSRQYSTIIDGTTYYMITGSSTNDFIPLLNDNNLVGPPQDNMSLLVYYTYGDGAIGETPSINWGTLKDIGFSASLATNGTVNVGLNRDKIYWNGLTDTLDNELTENQKVEIHAQGTYYTQVQSGVISFTEWITSITFDDMQLSGTSDVLLGTFNANKGYAEFSWNAVANALNLPIQNTSAYKDNDIWYQDGWIYKVRLTDPTTGYIGNWQTLYTITAMPPEQTQNVYNTSFLNENIINVVNEVNNINNDTNENNYVTENYEINNTVINYPENPDGNNIIDDSIEQEDEYITQLDTQLTDIDTSPLNLLGIQGIQNAFEWIRAVHLRTVEQTTLGTVTGIIMLIGLAVYLIGRRRG